MTPSAPSKRVIPFGGWVAAGIVFLLGFLFFSVLFIRESHAPVPIKLLFPILLPLILAGYTLLIGYIYGDARRRGMRYVMWTLLAMIDVLDQYTPEQLSRFASLAFINHHPP